MLEPVPFITEGSLPEHVSEVNGETTG